MLFTALQIIEYEEGRRDTRLADESVLKYFYVLGNDVEDAMFAAMEYCKETYKDYSESKSLKGVFLEEAFKIEVEEEFKSPNKARNEFMKEMAARITIANDIFIINEYCLAQIIRPPVQKETKLGFKMVKKTT